MKIVLTGGPSAGKTSTVEVLYRNYWNRLKVVPEAASILFQGGFPRGTQPNQAFHIQCQQRAIYRVQKELEALGEHEAGDRALICDRGSLDGLAYWPNEETSLLNQNDSSFLNYSETSFLNHSETSFLAEMESTMEKEIGRYAWVIHLETAPPFGYKLTPIRTETDSEARVIDQKVRHAWRHHPNRIVIPNSTSFVTKIETAVKVVNMILDGANKEAITEHLGFLIKVPDVSVA